MCVVLHYSDLARHEVRANASGIGHLVETYVVGQRPREVMQQVRSQPRRLTS